ALPFLARVITAHGGKTTLHVGAGLRLGASLPRVMNTPRCAGPMLCVLPFVSVAPTGHSRRAYLLLVGGHGHWLPGRALVVRFGGYACEIATSAAEALQVCDAQRPRVVVTDLTMPNLDGRGLAGWLSARYPSVPLLLMTGQDLDEATVADLRRTFAAVLR